MLPRGGLALHARTIPIRMFGTRRQWEEVSMHIRLRIAFGFFVTVCLFTTAPLHAQNRGSITGTVRDATGAVLPNAQVAVTDVGTGVTLKTTTNANGDYLVAALPAATYNLKVTATGFKAFEATGIILPVGEKARVDATMEVGQITSEISVQ